MSKLSQGLLGVALLCLVACFIFVFRQLSLTAVDIKAITAEDTPVKLELAAKGLADRPISFEIVDQPIHGNVTILEYGYYYFPTKNYHGSDRLTYKVIAGSKESDKAEVLLTINSVNDTPAVHHLSVMGSEDNAINIRLTGDDIDGDSLDFQILEKPNHGILTGTIPNLTYIPDRNYSGLDSFIYCASDSLSTSEQARVAIEIVPVNDPPKPVTSKITAFENTTSNFTLESKDPDSKNVYYQIIEHPKHGILKLHQEKVSYIPTRNFIGNDRFFYIARDDFTASPPAAVDIIVGKIDREINLSSVLRTITQSGGVAVGNFVRPEHIFHSGRYIPASVLKIVTAAASLHYFGVNYKFKTEFYVDSKRNLYIKGYGDPALSSKNWHFIAQALRKKNIFDQDLNNLVIDTSVFSQHLEVDGRRHTIHSYDAPPSVLATNQNTVAVIINKNRTIKVIDDYTPLTPLSAKKSKKLPAGYQRFNVAMDSHESIQYSSELVQTIFEEYGAYISNKVVEGRIPKSARRVYTFRSGRRLKSIVKEMLKDSNNFIANQLLLTLAFELKGEGATIYTGAKIITEFLKKEIGLKENDFVLVEGSGLSTKNNFDLLAMLKIVNYFNGYKKLLPHLKYSKHADLASAGRRWNIVAKSGTLSNVETLAGFLQDRKKEWKPFVIMVNNDEQKRGTIMEILAKYYNS